MVILLAAVFAAAGLTTQKAMAQENQGSKEQAAAPKGQLRWHGEIVRMGTDQSTLDVRRGTITKTIYYDSSTKWTEGTKAVEMSQFKEGADVVCWGTSDAKGNIHATKIDLRHR
jgi:hypothetical protein